MKNVIRELDHASVLFRQITFKRNTNSLLSLEPITEYLGAEMSSFRVLSSVRGLPAIDEKISFEIPETVHDAYESRYSRLDPVKRLLRKSLSEPMLSHERNNGEWSLELITPVSKRKYQAEFETYQKEFLFPNDLYHHVGFCLEDGNGRKLLYDFHRGKASLAFDDLSKARAEVVALYLHAKIDSAANEKNLGIQKQLSRREYEVVSIVAQGLSNKEIATQLSISVRTVENHLRSVFAKLLVKTRTQLIAKLRSY